MRAGYITPHKGIVQSTSRCIGETQKRGGKGRGQSWLAQTQKRKKVGSSHTRKGNRGRGGEMLIESEEDESIILEREGGSGCAYGMVITKQKVDECTAKGKNVGSTKRKDDCESAIKTQGEPAEIINFSAEGREMEDSG